MAKQNSTNMRIMTAERFGDARKSELALDNEDLRARLEEAEETLRAIRSGEVDAVIVAGPQGEQVFTLRGADYAYRALVEAMNEGAATITAEGLVTYCNKRFATLLGVPEKRVIGRLVYALVPPIHQASVKALFERAVNGQAEAAEYRFEAEDGTPRVVHVSLSRVEAEDAAAMCMVVTDLTRHQSEVMLRLAHTRQRGRGVGSGTR